MNILLLTAHSIAEYDDLRMFSDLGYDVFSIGAYTRPGAPTDDKRPALLTAPDHPELAALVQGDQMVHKAHLPGDVIDWADVIIAHHYPEQWLFGQWDRIRHKRIVWRTCGQSDPRLEMSMAPLRRDGMQIVRYSPKEREYFEAEGAFAGQDALIRFGKYIDDYGPWLGTTYFVGNATQNMLGRGDHVGYSFWRAATEGLNAQPSGPGSEAMPGGIGSLSYDEFLEHLARLRAYLYTGTVPASYTLGLIEAMLTGVPVVSIGSQAWLGPTRLFEGAEIAGLSADRPGDAKNLLLDLLHDDGMAQTVSQRQRSHATALFDVQGVGAQWAAFLGAPAVLEARAVAVSA